MTRSFTARIPSCTPQRKPHFGVGRQKVALGAAAHAQRLRLCVCARAGPASGSAIAAPASCLRDTALSRVAQAQCPWAKMAARCPTRWLLAAVGSPRLPATAGRGARPPRGDVVGASLGHKLNVTAFSPSLRARGSGALLTLRTGVSFKGEGRLQRPSRGSKAQKGLTRFGYGGSGVDGIF